MLIILGSKVLISIFIKQTYLSTCRCPDVRQQTLLAGYSHARHIRKQFTQISPDLYIHLHLTIRTFGK